ncbi:MAG: HAD-IA family hydrolase [Bacilli bacterium]|nr:HAD-IA family hydrolase [Bacilli bacterium]
MKRLLIFDLDGTLINTLIDLNNAVNFALKKNGFPLKSVEHTRLAIGNGVAKLVARSIPENESNPKYEQTLKDFRDYYSIHNADNTLPYDGVKEALFNLKSRNFILAVATNKISDVARVLIEEMYPGMFDFVQGDEPNMIVKPNPKMVTSLCERFHVLKDEALYVGDTEVDRQTAENSGVDYYLVTYGYRSKEELKKLCPTSRTIDSLQELEEILKNG